MISGNREGWAWIVCHGQIGELPQLVLDHHNEQRLAITAFDSGPITPSFKEQAIGWTLVGDAMVSPPLSRNTNIPCDNFDEWYVFPELPMQLSISDRYVNYSGFTLADPVKLVAGRDTAWDPRNHEWLIPIQTAFWQNLTSVNPLTYVASGDSDIIVTRSMPFAESVAHAARKTVA